MALARTIANWTFSLALSLALALAPAAFAFPACPSMTADMSMQASSTKPPCDMPCKGCSQDATKNACKGDCVCVKTMIASPLDAPVPFLMTARLDPQDTEVQLVLVHPPDTPPPRTLLA